MDGEQRGEGAGWPAARPGRQAPHDPAPGADPDATQAYPGPLAGNRTADPAATQVYRGPSAGTRTADPAATQVYRGPSAGFPGWGAAAGTTAAGTPVVPEAAARPGAPTQAFGSGLGAGPVAGPVAGPGAGGRGAAGAGFDTVAFQGPAGGYAGGAGADRPQGYDQQGYDQGGYDQQGVGGQPGYAGPGGFGQQGGFGVDGRPPGQVGPTQVYPGGPSGPGQPGSRNGSGGPSRSLVLTSLGVAALLAVAAGTVYAVSQSSDSTGTATPPAQTIDTVAPSTTSAAPSATTSSPSTTASATTSTTTTPTTATATGGTAPTGYVQDPWAQGLDFGTILAVKKQGGGAVIQVKRQQFLTGDAAKQYYAQHPDKEPMDYAIVDVWEKHQFTVTGDCLVYGQYLLGDHNQLSMVQLSVPQFVAKTKALLSKQIPLHVWMYHKNGQNGPVVYLAEQYTP
jgi:hypothetical protein